MADMSRVRAKFRKKENDVRRAAQDAVDRAAKRIMRTMRNLAPKDEMDLEESIRMLPTRKRDFIGTTIVAGNEATMVTNSAGQRFNNAKLQEVGTVNMPARPFFNPAKRQHARGVNRAIQRAVSKAWKT